MVNRSGLFYNIKIYKTKEKRMVKLWFAKVRPDGIIPSKRREDAGYDIFLAFDGEYIRLEPHETKLLPTGIASAFEPGYYFQIQERGSTGSRGIGKRCGVIDSGYRGEWFVPMTNLNTVPLYFAKESAGEYLEGLKERGERFNVYYITKAVCQAVLLPVPETEITEIPYDELMEMKSLRMTGSLGSSGK